MKTSKNFILSVVFIAISFFAGFFVPSILYVLTIQKQPTALHFLLSLGAFVICILNIVFILPKIKYVRFLTYPACVLALFNWADSFSFLFKNDVLIMAAGLIFVPLMAAAYIWGLIKDIDDVKRDYKEGNMFATILFFVVSLVALLYVVFIVSPFGGKYIFYTKHVKSLVPVYLWMTIPAYVLSVFFCIWIFEKLCKIRCVAYSFMAFNLCCGLFYCLLSGGGIVHGAIVFLIILAVLFILFPIMVASSILGGIQDAQGRDKIQKDQNQTSSC